MVKGSGASSSTGTIDCHLPLDLFALLKAVEEAAAAVPELRSRKGSRRPCDGATGNRTDNGSTANFFELVVMMLALVTAFYFSFREGLGCQVFMLGPCGECESGGKSCADEDCVPSLFHRNLHPQGGLMREAETADVLGEEKSWRATCGYVQHSNTADIVI